MCELRLSDPFWIESLLLDQVNDQHLRATKRGPFDDLDWSLTSNVSDALFDDELDFGSIDFGSVDESPLPQRTGSDTEEPLQQQPVRELRLSAQQLAGFPTFEFGGGDSSGGVKVVLAVHALRWLLRSHGLCQACARPSKVSSWIRSDRAGLVKAALAPDWGRTVEALPEYAVWKEHFPTAQVVKPKEQPKLLLLEDAIRFVQQPTKRMASSLALKAAKCNHH